MFLGWRRGIFYRWPSRYASRGLSPSCRLCLTQSLQGFAIFFFSLGYRQNPQAYQAVLVEMAYLFLPLPRAIGLRSRRLINVWQSLLQNLRPWIAHTKEFPYLFLAFREF